MFKKDYSWVNIHMENALNNDCPLTYEAFKILKEDIKKLQNENIKLKKGKTNQQKL